MPTNRLEAFSDGVLAIIITIMVLELKIPEEPTLHAASESATGVLTYLLSFVYIGIYWNNHHHFYALVHHIRGGVLWANLHLLFWLSLLPFTTAWMDESHFAQLPVMVYGGDLLLCAIAWTIMQFAVIRAEGSHSIVPTAIGRDHKGKLSPFLYVAGILASLLSPILGVAIYTIVAVMWLVPDRRFERHAAAVGRADS
jgi:uncharacterized membrane protein